MLKIRRSCDRPIFNMGILYLGKTVFIWRLGLGSQAYVHTSNNKHSILDDVENCMAGCISFNYKLDRTAHSHGKVCFTHFPDTFPNYILCVVTIFISCLWTSDFQGIEENGVPFFLRYHSPVNTTLSETALTYWWLILSTIYIFYIAS